jgi:hypothetical protein
MKKLSLTVILAALSLSITPAANAVLTGPTAAPDYEAGKFVYFNPAAASDNAKCKIDDGDLTKAVKGLQDKYKTAGITPIVVIEQRGTTSANDALKAFRSQELPENAVTVFVTCSRKGVGAAGYPGKLFQGYVTAEQWQGIMKLAEPKLNVAPDQFVTQVLEGAMSQIETGALAEAQKKVDAEAKAKKEAEAAAALAKQQNAIAEKAKETQEAIEDARNGSSWVAWTFGTLVVIVAVGFVIYRRRSKTAVK